MVKTKRSFSLDSGSPVFGITPVCAVPIGTKEALFVSGFLCVEGGGGIAVSHHLSFGRT